MPHLRGFFDVFPYFAAGSIGMSTSAASLEFLAPARVLV